MATIDTALFIRLSNYAGLTALVAARIYHNVRPQNATWPLVIYQEIFQTPIHAFQAATTVRNVRYQIDSYATTMAAAKAIAAQIELALNYYSGTSDTVTIKFGEFVIGQEMGLEVEEDKYRYMQLFDLEFIKP